MKKSALVEMALAELIDKIIPGLDSGDILADARQAGEALTPKPRGFCDLECASHSTCRDRCPLEKYRVEGGNA